jgi:hypothetical protein
VALGIDDVPETHDVAIRGRAEDERVDGQQRVEPPPRLVDGLGDEVSGILELLGRAGYERVADLGRGHRSRVEPGVDDRFDPASTMVTLPAAGSFPTIGAVELHLVDGRAVRVDPAHVAAGEVRQMGSGVPQNRSRDNAQSTLLASHSPNRPSRMCSGCQSMPRFAAIISCLRVEVATYQLGLPQ